MARWTCEVALSTYGPVVLAGGSSKLYAHEDTVGYVDRSHISNDTLLLTGGLDRLADFYCSHSYEMLGRSTFGCTYRSRRECIAGTEQRRRVGGLVRAMQSTITVN